MFKLLPDILNTVAMFQFSYPKCDQSKPRHPPELNMSLAFGTALTFHHPILSASLLSPLSSITSGCHLLQHAHPYVVRVGHALFNDRLWLASSQDV
ncbi:hypothetical protein PAXRUDRAFT_514457 [Paxillus rubicundulus Ve08.2h10]|uniref:Uncharacterized protein n=1 Tax=Paxillus rubicundulus Ve08.2h10 TaxID=930991 RepID=A0A0D0DNN7_9AGAM|nr:hypothetical protein PAXRUDRAFT_514457 [Paxillus rubicundulus Ve08.2h10]